MSSPSPRVSIAIPVYNGAETIRGTLESALEQTYADLEVIVVDNASTDGTADIVHSYNDSRIHLYRNPSNLGFLPNHNRSVEYARGEFIKPLHADDRLLPHCVERMLEVFDRHDRVGLVFAPRRIELADESDAELREWRDFYAHAHRNFSGLQPINDGPTLLNPYLRAGIPANWIGEPSCLMMRRASVERVGLYSPNVHAFNDLDMSVRLMALFDVGFVDEELSIYRRHRGSIIAQLKHNEWLDRLWMLEGLSCLPESQTRLPELAPALARERRGIPRLSVRTVRRNPRRAPRKLRDLSRYASYRAQRAAGRRPLLHPPLNACPEIP